MTATSMMRRRRSKAQESAAKLRKFLEEVYNKTGGKTEDLKDFDDAEAARRVGRKGLVIAEGRNLDSHSPGHLQNGAPFLCSDLSAVDLELDHSRLPPRQL